MEKSKRLKIQSSSEKKPNMVLDKNGYLVSFGYCDFLGSLRKGEKQVSAPERLPDNIEFCRMVDGKIVVDTTGKKAKEKVIKKMGLQRQIVDLKVKYNQAMVDGFIELSEEYMSKLQVLETQLNNIK